MGREGFPVQQSLCPWSPHVLPEVGATWLCVQQPGSDLRRGLAIWLVPLGGGQDKVALAWPLLVPPQHLRLALALALAPPKGRTHQAGSWSQGDRPGPALAAAGWGQTGCGPALAPHQCPKLMNLVSAFLSPTAP